MTRKIQMLALSALFALPVMAMAEKETRGTVVVPIGSAVPNVIEIGVSPSARSQVLTTEADRPAGPKQDR